jgi:hypothetical protein
MQPRQPGGDCHCYQTLVIDTAIVYEQHQNLSPEKYFLRYYKKVSNALQKSRKKEVRTIFETSVRRQAVAGCVVENASWLKVVR